MPYLLSVLIQGMKSTSDFFCGSAHSSVIYNGHYFIYKIVYSSISIICCVANPVNNNIVFSFLGGRMEEVHIDKITSRIKKLCYGLNMDFVDPVSIN